MINRNGYVYLLKVINTQHVYKIGRTNNPSNRLRTFNVKLPFPVNYHHVIKTNDMYELEKQLHAKFAKNRLRKSEFFRLFDEDVSFILELGEYADMKNLAIESQPFFRMDTEVKKAKKTKSIVIDPNDAFDLSPSISKRRSKRRRK